MTHVRLKTIGIVIVMATLALALAIGLLVKPTQPALPATVVAATPIPVQPVPTASAGLPVQADEAITTVNGEAITGAAWDRAVRLDTAMNALAGQAASAPDDILVRLINEKLLLAAAKSKPAFTAADVEARMRTLMTGWHVSEGQMLSALAAVNLSRQDLQDRILDLLAVEAVMQQFTAEGVDLNVWLEQARARNSAVTPEPELPAQPYPESPAPDFNLYTLNNEPVNLKALRGKPTLINFWATWCPPCRQEMPALQATYEQYGAALNFMSVNVKESAGAVEPFIQEIGATFPVLLDEDGAVSGGLYQVNGIPTTFFLDAEGVIVARHVGPLSEEMIASYLQTLLPAQEVSASTTPADQSIAQADKPAPLFTAVNDQGELFDLAETLKTGPVALVFYRGHT